MFYVNRQELSVLKCNGLFVMALASPEPGRLSYTVYQYRCLQAGKARSRHSYGIEVSSDNREFRLPDLIALAGQNIPLHGIHTTGTVIHQIDATRSLY